MLVGVSQDASSGRCEIARPSAGQMVQCNGAAVPLEDESAVTDKYQRDIVISAKLEHASAAYLARCGSASRPTVHYWDVAKAGTRVKPVINMRSFIWKGRERR